MQPVSFKGFGGAVLKGDALGSPDDPAVLLIHGGAQTRAVWEDVADALVKAGRHVIRIDLRGHGDSERPLDGRYDFESLVEDLRAVLAQMASRPVIVAASVGGWAATAAIGEEGAHLAAGLVLIDSVPDMDFDAACRQETGASDNSIYDPAFAEVFDTETAVARVSDAAAHINMPVLFVRGARSELSGVDDANRFLSKLENVEYAEIRDAGQMVAAERADMFSATLLDFLERRVPRFAPEYRQGSDARTLRDALGCFATGVTVVTTLDGDGQPVGLTANSFTSVSLDPPLLLVCIAKSAGSLSAMEAAENFAVNVLHIGQQPTSNLFARSGEDRFAATPWRRGHNGAPLLSGALANFECRRHALHEGGDHVILVGEVVRARFEPRRDPLLYFRGKYRRLHFA
ncbi:alpha/beta fold hydrolase [Hyphomonas sp.]|uniref:alpha/beta fold hydrolase n=1 Tax=Hyphomonas sp. TaxID=87 RepID=UPI0035275BF9